jgi:hypothetical protein
MRSLPPSGAALALSAALLGAGPAVAAAATSVSYRPVADARVAQARPAVNYGGATRLATDGGTGVRVQTLLQFRLRDLGAPVRSAILRVRVADGTKAGPYAKRTTGEWREDDVTWNTRPAPSGAATRPTGRAAQGTWAALDVTRLIRGDGRLSLVLAQVNTDGLAFDSSEKEGSEPRLVVTTGAAGGPPAGIVATTSADYGAIRSLGFDHVVASAYRTNLDRARAAGLKVSVWLGGFDYRTCSWNWPESKLRGRLAEIRGHPAIHSYQVDDEPHDVCANVTTAMERRDAIIREYDPDALTFISENREEAFDELAGTVDVLAVVEYPCNHESGCAYSEIGEKAAAARAAGWTRLWGMPQTAADGHYRMPAAPELSTILDHWRAAGVEGLLGYVWDGHGDDGLSGHPELWDAWRAENAR